MAVVIYRISGLVWPHVVALIAAFGGALAAQHAAAVDLIKISRDGRDLSLLGNVVVTAQDGGLLLLSPEGTLWTIEPEEVLERVTEQPSFEPLTADQAAAKLLQQLPAGFEVHRTANYAICFNTTRAYAQWVGALYERLFSAFTNYWAQRGFPLQDSKLPLVVLLFSDRESYARHAEEELGKHAGAIVAYYSLRSNRVTMYDLTGVESLRRPGDRRGSTTEIQRMLSRPEAAPMVATIVHEATHQLAFNRGLHQRLADVPLWVSEGMAVYFETPDLSSTRGWRTIGAVNYPRLRQFRDYLARRPPESMRSLIEDDRRLRDPRQALDAYAEAWALTYFLMRQRPKEYANYVDALSRKQPLIWDEPAERLQQFQATFGSISELEPQFLKHIERVR